ncbi:MAG: hypothetical protein M3336_15550, partial [Chloroflexota bacterium]|nr:hypothetical protein [Chloroflexota bacterium]
MQVLLDASRASIGVRVDGQAQLVTATVGDGWRSIVFEQPGPLEREYQVDGSASTATDDRRAEVILALLRTPLYRLLAWLRDEDSFSRWERVRIVDVETGQEVPGSMEVLDSPRMRVTEFRFQSVRTNVLVSASLRRPEAAARVWLVGAGGDVREGFELDRDRRNARWLIERGGQTEALPRVFFPEQAAPFAASLLHLLGRAAMAGYALLLAATVLGRLPGARDRPWLEVITDRRFGPVALAGWLLAAAVLDLRVYHQLPHILDAVSYRFQAGVLSIGRLWLPPPHPEAAFKGPFQVSYSGHWFSQYPPGAPAAYAAGSLVGLDWLVGAIACAVLIGATSWTAGVLFGRGAGLVVLLLGLTSPFILFQAGSFLSHPIAGGVLAAALASFVRAERTAHHRWYGVTGVLLGAGFLTREAATLLFALPLVGRLLAAQRGGALGWLTLGGLPCVVLYLLYTAALTGSPVVLARALFDPSDRFGFGDGLGFHRRHTVAAGLANTDELLTLLQFDLFGWPPLFSLGLLLLVFLAGRPATWDWLAGCGALAFFVAYAAYFYHGIALGPRYYFEALPWLLLLAGRGARTLAHAAGSRVVA